jgi:hypothetical protein
MQEPFCTVFQTLPALVLEVLLVYRRKYSEFNLRFSSDLTPLGRKKVREEAKYTRVVLFVAHKDTKPQYGRRNEWNETGWYARTEGLRLEPEFQIILWSVCTAETVFRCLIKTYTK